MKYLAMPVGNAHGWGICGKYIAREMAGLAGAREVALITQQMTAESVGDELEFMALAELVKPVQAVGGRVDGPLLNCIVDKQLLPMVQGRGTRTVGYTFFEENILQPAWIENGRRHFDVIATGSSWCTRVLKEAGLEQAETVVQGVDPRVFFHAKEGPLAEREFFRDQFVIFSGGKFELRKGQDLVVRAVAVLQQRHKDVVLVNAWYNAWQNSFDTMKRSPHLQWPNASGAYAQVMNQLLAHNGCDVSRVVTLTPKPNALMAKIYRNSDVGVFPNRCEGGTNLVLMEYMASGRAVVATASTGHEDVVKPEWARIVGTPTELTLNDGAAVVARWPEPSLDETVEGLEWAYQHREELKEMGTRAGQAMAGMTWTETARRFLALMGG